MRSHSHALDIERLASRIGIEFFRTLVLEVVRFTGATHGMIGRHRLDPDDPGGESVVAVFSGELTDNIRFTIEETISARVFAGEACVLPSGAARAHPGDEFLEAVQPEALVGIPLTDRQDRVHGIFMLLFDHALEDGQDVADVLDRFAQRAAAELERLSSQQELERSEARYRRMIEDSDDGFVIHRDGKLAFVNSATARMLGYENKDALPDADSIMDFVAPEYREMVARRAAERQLGKREENHYEAELLGRDGSRIRVQISSTLMEWEGRAALQVHLVDVSERTEREARERQAQRMEALGSMTGGIAHDFNNLLSVVLGSLELVADRMDADSASILGQARVAAERGADLTARLLAFSRKQALEPSSVDLAMLMEETRGLLERVLREDIELRIEMNAQQAPWVDASQLQNAIINLGINARDAMARGGVLEIVSTDARAEDFLAQGMECPDGQHVIVEVRDTGSGMSRDVLEQALDPFFTTKGAGRGSGLGLATVHGFVAQSNGTMDIASEPGRGTVVRLCLPVDPPGLDEDAVVPTDLSDSMAEIPALVGVGRGGEARRVLVVEDEAGVRDVVVSMLEGLGFDVHQAADGSAARDVYEHQGLDLLVCDVVLPGGQRGPEIARSALEVQPELAVLFMSGYSESEAFADFANDEGFRLLRKPFRLQDLQKAVARVLRGREAH